MDELLNWFKENRTSSDIVKINQKLNELGLMNVTLAHDVSIAFEVMTTGKHNYDVSYSKRFLELRGQKVSIQNAEAQAEVEMEEAGSVVARATVTHKRLQLKQSAVVLVMETFKQYVSSLKKEREI